MLMLRLPAVKGKMGHRADATIYNAIRDGLITTGVAIGQRARGWPDYEIDAINAARVAGKSDFEIRALVRMLHAKRAESFEWARQSVGLQHLDRQYGVHLPSGGSKVGGLKSEKPQCKSPRCLRHRRLLYQHSQHLFCHRPCAWYSDFSCSR